MLNNQPSLDVVFQALADPVRRQLVDRLSRGPASISALAEPFDISLPAIMQHVRALEASGLVTTQKQGRVRTCTLDVGALTRAEHWLNERRRTWLQRLDRLDALLAEDDAPPPDKP